MLSRGNALFGTGPRGGRAFYPMSSRWMLSRSRSRWHVACCGTRNVYVDRPLDSTKLLQTIHVVRPHRRCQGFLGRTRGMNSPATFSDNLPAVDRPMHARQLSRRSTTCVPRIHRCNAARPDEIYRERWRECCVAKILYDSRRDRYSRRSFSSNPL